MALRDWEKHVMETVTGSSGTSASGTSFCGVALEFYDWSFVDADHALRAVEQGMRLQPCPACLSTMDAKAGGR